MAQTTLVTRAARAALACMALALPVAGHADSQSFAATATLPAGGYRAVRLTGVPAASNVRIDLRTTAALGVILLTEAEGRRFPDTARPVAHLEATGDSTLTVRAPERGRYLVILDNRKGTAEALVAVAVTVSVE